MSDSILEWLNKEKPSREVVLDKLGKGEFSEFFPSSDDNYLLYRLKFDGFIGGYLLGIDFNADGSFKEASILNPD